MDERQRYEFGNAAAALLQFSQNEQMDGPVNRTLKMTKHDRAGRSYPQPMGRADHIDPLFGIDLVGTDTLPNVVVKNFCRGARQGCQSRIGEITEKRFN